MKRCIDIVGAMAGLIVIAPLTPFIALAIKLNSQGPVLVELDRVSAGQVIKAYKFRSMIANADQIKSQYIHLNQRTDGPYFKIVNDPRVTSVGHWLRKFRLDEFPQLINVLRGELTLVGPRPHEPNEVAAYPENYRHIPLARAGVTGFSQVNGSSSLPFLKELELDDYYLKNQSLWFDLKIIAKTLLILFSDPTAI
ncbi:MAG: sugar transferase [Patescibacteria group bacterium]